MKKIVSAEEQYFHMTETPVSKLVITLAIPTVISMLVTNIYNMADTYFVGTIGTAASGATGIVMGLMSILQAFGFMFGHGAGTNIARRLGNKDTDAAKIYASSAFWLSILAGLLLLGVGFCFMDPLMRLLGSTDTILPFARAYAFFILLAGPAMTSSCVMNNILRYEGKAFYAMIGLTLGGVLNILGDFLFVRCMHMGIAGAGLSTTISQYISMIVLLVPYLQRKTQSSFHLKDISTKKYIYHDIFSMGLPSLLRQGLNSVSAMVVNGTAGLYGDAAVAAISIVNRIVNFLFCVAVGIGQGFQPVSSFSHGAKIYSRVKQGFYFSLVLSMVCMFVFAGISFFTAESFIAFFRNDPEVIAIGIHALRWQSLSLVLMPITMVGNMLFQSIGRSKAASFLAALRSGIVLIPAVYIMNWLFHLSGLEAAQSIAEVLSALITWPIIQRYFRTLSKDGK